MNELDELFGEGQGAPKPQTTLAMSLLVGGFVVAVLGMACSSAPGGILVLLGWMVAEKDKDRLASGYLSRTDTKTVSGTQTLAQVAVILVIALFVAQMILFCGGFYQDFWLYLLDSIAALREGG